jgi:hypothetical protein
MIRGRHAQGRGCYMFFASTIDSRVTIGDNRSSWPAETRTLEARGESGIPLNGVGLFAAAHTQAKVNQQ